jgi:methylamine--corrinoid protein Co-methyltransferase
MGVNLTEDLFIPILQSSCQHKLIDQAVEAWISSVYGREMRTHTPTELIGEKYHAYLIKEATRRSGRPGLSVNHGSITLTGLCGKCAGMSNKDTVDLGVIAELKVDYDTLSKIAYILEIGYPLASFSHPMLGGYAGGPEGTSLIHVAHRLLEIPVFHTHIMANNDIFDMRYVGNTGGATLWANCIAQQALDNNIKALNRGISEPTLDLCDKDLLYEIAVPIIGYTVSGIEAVTGIRPAHGKYTNHVSGLEHKFGAEVANAAANLKRIDANEIVKKLLPKYEEKLSNPPKGKSFEECYDQRSLKPSEEWLGIYINTVRDLKDMGLPIE